MQEINPLKPDASSSMHPGKTIKEAWQISTTYFWPLTLAVFLIQIPEKILVSISNDNQSWKISAWYEMLVSGFVFVGVYRSIYKLKSGGIPPTFGGIFEEGQPFYGRNFRMTWLLDVFTILPLGLLGALAFPGLYALGRSEDQMRGYVVIGIIVFLGLTGLMWWAIRVFIYRAVLADDAPGGMKAISEAMRMTKGKVRPLSSIVLINTGIYLAWFLLHMSLYVLISGGFDTVISKGTEVGINLLTAFPFAFAEILTITTTALTYLRLKESAKSTAV